MENVAKMTFDKLKLKVGFGLAVINYLLNFLKNYPLTNGFRFGKKLQQTAKFKKQLWKK